MPSVSFQIGCQGQAVVSSKYDALQKWLRETNSDNWGVHTHDEHDVRKIRHRMSPHTLNAFDRGSMFQNIDLGRYMMLRTHGGCSVDMDGKHGAV